MKDNKKLVNEIISDVKHDMSNEEICDALVSAFQSLTFDGLTGTGATWSAEGAVTKDPTVVVIKDGKYVNV